jgi:YfiH family protein
MKSKPVDVLNALEKINWSRGPNFSDLFRRHGYENGVCGRQNMAYPELQPHHVQQVHGVDIIEASHTTRYENAQRSNADGLYTREKNVIAIKTADCLPILLASTNSRFALALHAGWRGFTAGILPNALKIARQFSQPESLIACIGPAISLHAFEVGREVVDHLSGPKAGLDADIWPIAVAKGNKDRWHIDLQVAAAMQLYLAGLSSSNIEIMRSCTRDESFSLVQDSSKQQISVWHSFRRDGKSCGSNWTWIKVN